MYVWTLELLVGAKQVDSGPNTFEVKKNDLGGNDAQVIFSLHQVNKSDLSCVILLYSMYFKPEGNTYWLLSCSEA